MSNEIPVRGNNLTVIHLSEHVRYVDSDLLIGLLLGQFTAIFASILALASDATEMRAA